MNWRGKVTVRGEVVLRGVVLKAVAVKVLVCARL